MTLAAPAPSVLAALGWLSSRQRDMEQLLAELVEISSHSPDLAGNTRVAERYVEAARALCDGALSGGVAPSRSGRHGAHVALRTTAPGAPVLLVGHHDTVFPKAKFSGFREDGARLRGPGVLDMKGGLVVELFALAALAHAGLLPRLPVRLVSISDEEIGSPEGRHLVLEEGAGAACALVFESGRAGDEIITRRKGLGAMTVKAEGRAGHAGNAHEQGINAIWAISRFIDRAQGLTDYARGLTVNVGTVAGGIGKNTVPDHAEASLDFRFLTQAGGTELIERLRGAAEEAQRSVPGSRLTVEGGIHRMPLERTEASAALCEEYAACARAEGLGGSEAPLSGGGSDANTVSAAGIPAIDALGPRGEGFHTVDEYIERDTLIPRAAALCRFLAGRLPDGAAG